MAYKTWQTLKICYCERAATDVKFEAEVVYPAEFMPDQAPRVLAHRCSNGSECNRLSKAACIWAGTNPAYDPFNE